LVNLPSILQGINRASTWRDFALKDSAESNGPQTNFQTDVNPLEEYFDSVTEGRGIWKWTHYFDIYHRHFQKFVGKPVAVVEIGVLSGGSLTMWKNYFGPHCSVYGIDIRPECKAYEDDRTRIFIGDQADRSFWRSFRNEVMDFDIVIDDGGHLPEQQIVTLEETLPYIRPGGVYLCEDVHGGHNRFAAYVHGLSTTLNSFVLAQEHECETDDDTVLTSPFQQSIGSIHTYPFVTVIEKRTQVANYLISSRRGTEWQPL
jgi:hypothetical protein